MSASNQGSLGREAAFKEATIRARKEQRSIAVRLTPQNIWYTAWTVNALRQGDIEVAYFHCDGRIEYID
jgi:hypothetical protein